PVPLRPHTHPHPLHHALPIYPVYSVAFSPDGPRLVSASDDGTVKVWGPTTDPEAHRLTSPGRVGGVAFSPDGQQLAAASEKGVRDRKSTRLNSSHQISSYAVF